MILPLSRFYAAAIVLFIQTYDDGSSHVHQAVFRDTFESAAFIDVV